MGCGGAETALLNLLETTPLQQEYDVELFVLVGQGELISRLPKYVKLINPTYNPMSVLSVRGTLCLYRTVLKALFTNGTLRRRADYLRHQPFASWQSGKAFWQVVADGAPRFDKQYDMAIAFIEGGATYYVANYVKARQKIAFVHVDYSEAGYSRQLDDDCYSKIDSIFAVSDEVRHAFSAIYPEYDVSVFHNKLNCRMVRENAVSFDAYPDGYDGFRLLTVGRLVPQKALDVSIEAMRLLKDHGIRARWYVLGDGPQRRRLSRLIRKKNLKDDFLLMGAYENPYPFFAGADLYIHASAFEGKSIAVQEAQILGKPIIVSDCSGNREQVENGVDGIVSHFSSASLCFHIERLLKDKELRRSFGRLSAQKIAKNDGDFLALLREISRSNESIA